MSGIEQLVLQRIPKAPAMLHFLLLTILAVSVSILPQADAYTIIHARAVPGGLRAARDAARLTISTRPTADVHVVVAPGSHSLTSPLNLGEADSGEAGRFKVVWRGAAPPSPSSVLDGGVSVPGPWTPWPGSVAGSAVKLWSAPLPGALRGKPVRQLYVNHARYTRTRSPTSGAAIRVIWSRRKGSKMKLEYAFVHTSTLASERKYLIALL